MQKTSQYYFALQRLKGCTKHFPVLLCTTKLAENTSQYSLYYKARAKVLPSSTLYCEACTKCSSWCYFVLQSLHKVLPRTTFYYFTRPAFFFTHNKQAFTQRSFYTEQAFAQKLLHRETLAHIRLLQTEAFTQSKLLQHRSFSHTHTHSTLLHTEAFTHSKLLHREAFTHRSF